MEQGLLISISGEDCIGSTNASLGIDTVLAPCLKKARESARRNFESPNGKEQEREGGGEGGREGGGEEGGRERESQMLTSDVCFRETPLSAG